MAGAGKNRKPPAGDGAGDGRSPKPDDAPGRIYLRIEVPAVLDKAIEAYAQTIAVSKAAAARSVLMRVFVKRDLRVPEPLNER